MAEHPSHAGGASPDRLRPSFDVTLTDHRGLPIAGAAVTLATSLAPVLLASLEPIDPRPFLEIACETVTTFTSDGDGRAAVRALLEMPLSHVDVWAFAPGFAVHTSGRIALPSGPLTIELRREARWTGRVVDAHGAPVLGRSRFLLVRRSVVAARDARVLPWETDSQLARALEGHRHSSLEPETWPYPVGVVTDDRGHFDVRGLAPDTYCVTREPPWFDSPALVALPDGTHRFGVMIPMLVGEELATWPAARAVELAEGAHRIDLVAET